MHRLAAALLTMTVGVGAFAQAYPGKFIWEDFDKRLKASEKVSPLGPNFAGETVSLSNGALRFSATDVSLPGSNSLKVEFARTYSAFSRKDYGDLGMLGDWTVDVPSISGTFAPNWLVGTSDSPNRCTDGSRPKAASPFHSYDFYQGLEINIPGLAKSELLRTAANVAKPTDGPTYYWVTNDRIHVSCITTLKSGTGQGFLAITPDGTRYTFDYMGQTPVPGSYIKRRVQGTHIVDQLVRRENFLYATKVEDRFGNTVTYTYDNAWNAPGRLTKIEASDGRVLNISYSGGSISTVSDGTRSWTYSFNTTASGRKTLSSVVLPDASTWTISLGSFTNDIIEYYDVDPGGEVVRTCTMNEEPLNVGSSFVGTIKHPAGATAEFTLKSIEHGRSFVPVNCRNVTTSISGPNRGADNYKNDDVNIYATSAYSFTLTKKKVWGPGITAAEWLYTYTPNTSHFYYDGTTAQWPVCDLPNYDCSPPPCTNESCAKFSVTTVDGPGNDWMRYVYGNTYRYNEGKLLRIETGSGPEDLLRSETHYYDLSLAAGDCYPPRFGVSAREGSDGFANESHRPEKRTEIIQQGVKFTREVTEFDCVARPVQVVRSSTVMSDPNAPDIPVPTLTGAATTTQATPHTVNWTAGDGISLYELQRKENSGSFSNIYSGSSLSASLSYPDVSTLTYRVRSCNGYGTCGAYSNELVVVVNAAALAKPTIYAPSPMNAPTTFNVSWNAVSGATEYALEKKINSGSYSEIVRTPNLLYTQTQNFGGTLRYRVKACNAGGCSVYSDEAVVTVAPPPIGP